MMVNTIPAGRGLTRGRLMKQDMRAWRQRRARRSRFVPLLCVCLLVSGCAALTDQSAAQSYQSLAQSDRAWQELRAECIPWKFPLSDHCTELTRESAGEDEAAEVRQQSDLTMAVWRACPSEDPCRQLPECQLYGQAMESGSRAAQDIARASCENAQKADYSCRSLQRDDPAYQTRRSALKACLGSRPPECNQPYPKLPPSASREAFEQWDDGFKEREDTCLCLKLMADDSSDECRQAWSRYSAFAEQLRAEYRQRYGYLRPAPTSSNTPPASEPATSEPDAASSALTGSLEDTPPETPGSVPRAQVWRYYGTRSGQSTGPGGGLSTGPGGGLSTGPGGGLSTGPGGGLSTGPCGGLSTGPCP